MNDSSEYFSEGYGGFRELREAGRKHFHPSWYLSDAVVTSYGFFGNIGFKNSGLTLELRVLVGMGGRRRLEESLFLLHDNLFVVYDLIRHHSVLIAPFSSFMVPSYVINNKKVIG